MFMGAPSVPIKFVHFSVSVNSILIKEVITRGLDTSMYVHICSIHAQLY